MKVLSLVFDKNIAPAVKRVVPRTRKELLSKIDQQSKKIKLLKLYTSDIKPLKTKHIDTILDAIDISKQRYFMKGDCNFSKRNEEGVRYRELLLSDMIDASRDNPEAMTMLDVIFRNVDKKTSKYLLSFMTGGILTANKLSKQMLQLSKVFPDIAKNVFEKKFRTKSQKRDDLMMWLVVILNPKTNPDKIVPLFRSLGRVCENIPKKINIKVNKFLQSSVPNTKIEDNIKVLPEVIELMGKRAKKLDVVDFVTKNTNLY